MGETTCLPQWICQKGWSGKLSPAGAGVKTSQHHWCSSWKHRDGDFLKQALASPELPSPCQFSSPVVPRGGRVIWPGPFSRELRLQGQSRDDVKFIPLTSGREGPLLGGSSSFSSTCPTATGLGLVWKRHGRVEEDNI